MSPRTKITTPPMAECLTTKDAIAYTGMSVRSLHRYAELELLTRYYVGGRLRWHTKQLDALVTLRRAVLALLDEEQGMKQTFDEWWATYWKNHTDTPEHTIARSIARDAWWAGRKSRRYQPHPATARRAIEAAEDAHDAIERAIYADLRRQVEGLPTHEYERGQSLRNGMWVQYTATGVSRDAVLALLDGASDE